MTKYIGYVGTYTKGGSEGIYSFELDTEKKALSEPKLAAKLGNPTYVATNKNNTILYSIEKADGQGGVAAYQIDKNSGELTFLNHQLIDGPSPCHVSVDDQNQFVLTAIITAGRYTFFRFRKTAACNHLFQRPLTQEKGARKTRKTAYTLRGVHT
ncbi:6-phosphogluconolactonase [Bacillus subtilis]|nr:6-phosphogluconolactonase [Bacillus subtilis]